MILCFMAAQDAEQLKGIRRTNSHLNRTILINQFDIVQCLFNSRKSLIGTASRLYNTLYRPVNPGITYLFRIARHCDIAKQLAFVLTVHIQNPGGRFDELAYGRFIRNISPYLLALGHFWESYRDGLANHIPYPQNADHSRTVEDLILRSRYDRLTIRRICALHYMLTQFLNKQIGNRTHQSRTIAMPLLANVRGTNDTDSTDYTDVFTFGGLEAVKDVMVQPTPTQRLNILEDHFARACPASMTHTHALPPSTLGTVGRATAERICRLLPPRNHPVLWLKNHGDFAEFRYSPGAYEELCLDHLYEYLVSYEGDEPQL